MEVKVINNEVVVRCRYEEKELVKAIGDYKFNKANATWSFPLRKLVDIIDNLHVEYFPETKVIYDHLIEEKQKYHSLINQANKIKAGEFEGQILDQNGTDLLAGCYEHQKKAILLASLFGSYALFMETGCVSGDTEYLTPTGWKRIDNFLGNFKEPIAQYNLEKQKAEFVKPLKYIRMPCQDMLWFKTTYGLDQMLSPEHRILSFWNTTSYPYVISAQEMFERHQKNKTGGKMRVLTAFHLNTQDNINISDDLLRLQIAVMADGHFPKQNKETNTKCRIRLRKERKIKRLKELLEKTSTSYKIHIDTDGQSSFTFKAPIKTKYFTEDFWKASYRQRQIICDEVVQWDGSIRKNNKGPVYFCHTQYDADFIQYCFASTNRKADIYSKDRGYKRKSYWVQIIGKGIKGNYVMIGKRKENITYQLSPDGYKYCFEVPSTFLILRRNGHIFVTGNTGKTLVAIKLITLWKLPAMVICPLSTIECVWRKEIEKWSNLTSVVLWKNLKAFSYDYNIYLLNYEQFKILSNKEDITKKIKCLVVDECSKMKNPRSAITKEILKYRNSIPHRLVLSGTPNPNSLLEYWAPMEFVNEEILG